MRGARARCVPERAGRRAKARLLPRSRMRRHCRDSADERSQARPAAARPVTWPDRTGAATGSRCGRASRRRAWLGALPPWRARPPAPGRRSSARAQFRPANALLLRDRGLEPLEQLFGSRSRLAALEIDDAHRQSLSLADPHRVRGRESVTASPLGSETSPHSGVSCPIASCPARARSDRATWRPSWGDTVRCRVGRPLRSHGPGRRGDPRDSGIGDQHHGVPAPPSGPRAEHCRWGGAAVAKEQRVGWNETGHARLSVAQALGDARAPRWAARLARWRRPARPRSRDPVAAPVRSGW